MQSLTLFSILDHLEALNIVRESRSEIVSDCPLCGTEGSLKIDPKTGKYFTFKCNCMDTDEGKKSLIQAIAPMEKGHYRSPRTTAPKPKQVAKLPPIEGPVKLARFDVIPTDRPHRQTNLPRIPDSVADDVRKAGANNSQVTMIKYSYGPNYLVTRYEWPDARKPKGYDKTFRQSRLDKSGKWQPNKGNDPWPAYRQDEVIAAKGGILFVEGEECVETSRCFLGVPATTIQGSDWSEGAIAQSLIPFKEAGCPWIAFPPDNDEAGEDKKQKFLSAAAKIGLPALIVPMTYLHPECPEKGDIADWVKDGQAKGMTQDDFIQRLEAEIQAAVNRRSQLSQESETVADKPVEGLNADDLRIKVKAFTQEKDQAKREVMLYELRKLGVGEKGVNRIAAQLSQNGATPRATRLSASEFRSRISGGKKWLVPGLIPQVGVTLITGPSGGGKSTFAFDLAGSVICGDRFMGEAIKENGPVVFACSDEPTDESQERALLQGFFHSDDFEFLEHWNLSQMEMLEEAIEDRRPKLVVVDSFDSIHREAGFDENATMASETIKQFNSLSQKYSCAFIVLHHENKDPKLSGVNKARGSTAIVASANAHLRIIGKDDNPEVKYVKIEKMRGGATKTILCNVDYHNVRFEPEVNLEYEQDKDGRTALVSFLRSNLNRWFEVQELNHYLGWSGKGIYRYLKQLTDRGEVSRKPNSMGRKGMVYGIFCTDGENPQDDLTPPSLVKSVSPEKKISESIVTQGLEVSHNLVTSQSHLVTSQSHTVTSETAETLSLTDSHTIDQKEGYPEGGGVTVDSVPMETATETAPIPVNNSTAINDQETTGAIASETFQESEIAFETFHKSEIVATGEQCETVETFQIGDRVTCPEYPGHILEIVAFHMEETEWVKIRGDWWPHGETELSHISELKKVRD